jgi:hypothetical protein
MTSTTETFAEFDLPRLGAQLLTSARQGRDRIAVQALVDEESILALKSVRTVLVEEKGRRMTAQWERLSGRVYTLGLDAQQRAFLGLVLSVVGIGLVTLAAVEDLDERRMLIIQRTILRLTGNDRVAIGTRL